MATGVIFKCEKCGKSFKAVYGGFIKDMATLRQDEQEGLRQISDRDSAHLGQFVVEVQGHSKDCNGVIKYFGNIMAG